MNCGGIDCLPRWPYGSCRCSPDGAIVDTMIEMGFRFSSVTPRPSKKLPSGALPISARGSSTAKSSVSQHEISRAREHEPVLLGLFVYEACEFEAMSY